MITEILLAATIAAVLLVPTLAWRILGRGMLSALFIGAPEFTGTIASAYMAVLCAKSHLRPAPLPGDKSLVCPQPPC